MIRRPFSYRSSAIMMTSLAAMVPKPYVKAETPNNLAKKMRDSVLTRPDLGRSLTTGLSDPPSLFKGKDYPWKTSIVTTTFWAGEKPTKNNPAPNSTSSWDPHWAANYGGTDTP